MAHLWTVLLLLGGLGLGVSAAWITAARFLRSLP